MIICPVCGNGHECTVCPHCGGVTNKITFTTPIVSTCTPPRILRSKSYLQAEKILKFLTRKIWLDRCAIDNHQAIEELENFMLSDEYKGE